MITGVIIDRPENTKISIEAEDGFIIFTIEDKCTRMTLADLGTALGILLDNQRYKYLLRYITGANIRK